jgi:hypothetical protein
MQRRARGFILALDPSRSIGREERQRTDSTTAVVFSVPSGSLAGIKYDVYVEEDNTWVCGPCPDYRENHRPCKHIYEIVDRFYPEIAPPPPDPAYMTAFNAGGQFYRGVPRSPVSYFEYEDGLSESTRRDHALQIEDDRVAELLEDLVPVVNAAFPVVLGRGRRSLTPGEKVMAMVLRSQHTKSMRKFQSHLAELEEEGRLRFGPCKTSLVRYNGSTDTTRYLIEAYRIVIAPYRMLERHVIVDATGFSPRLVSNWLDHSAAVAQQLPLLDYRPETVWLKLHVIIGRISKVIIGFRLTPSSGPMSADATLFPYLLDDIMMNGFEPQFVIGDNIYLTPDNFEAARQHGAFLINPLRPRNWNAKTNTARGVAKHMAEFMEANPELALELTRARQAIEGIFSTEKNDDNHLAAAGTKLERKAMRAAAVKALEANPELAGVLTDVENGLYVSRMNEILIRMIRQVLRRTVNMELRWNRRVSYRRGTMFGPVRDVVA